MTYRFYTYDHLFNGPTPDMFAEHREQSGPTEEELAQAYMENVLRTNPPPFPTDEEFVTYFNSKKENSPDGSWKDDSDKVDMTYLAEYFPKALEAVAMVSEFGAEKYHRGGWRHVSDGIARYTAALWRHMFVAPTDFLDSESELPHLAHAAWNALAVLELELLKQEG